jgi:long-chain acyl-CoA synthetase
MDEGVRVSIAVHTKDMILTGGYNVLLGGDRTGPRGASRRGAGGGGQTTRRYEGEIANADMSLKEGATGTEQVMIDLCRECLASYRCPRQIQFVDDIPKTSTNKIMRGELHTLDDD